MTLFQLYSYAFLVDKEYKDERNDIGNEIELLSLVCCRAELERKGKLNVSS